MEVPDLSQRVFEACTTKPLTSFYHGFQRDHNDDFIFYTMFFQNGLREKEETIRKTLQHMLPSELISPYTQIHEMIKGGNKIRYQSAALIVYGRPKEEPIIISLNSKDPSDHPTISIEPSVGVFAGMKSFFSSAK